MYAKNNYIDLLRKTTAQIIDMEELNFAFSKITDKDAKEFIATELKKLAKKQEALIIQNPNTWIIIQMEEDYNETKQKNEAQ